MNLAMLNGRGRTPSRSLLSSVLAQGAGDMADETTESFDAEATLSHFQESLPIALIATPRAKLQTCAPEAEVADAIGARGEFDYLPVEHIEPDGRKLILGVLEAAKLERAGCPPGRVGDHMERLSERILIGANASILFWLSRPERNGCRFLLLKGEITGFITPSDVQHLAVRAAVFAMLAHLEATLAAAIRREFPLGDAWLERLPTAARKQVAGRIQAARDKDIRIDELNYTDLPHKYCVVAASPHWDEISLSSEQFAKIGALRNTIAHGKAMEPADDLTLSECVQQILQWTPKIAAWTPRESRATTGPRKP
jgi:hypothetical protein